MRAKPERHRIILANVALKDLILASRAARYGLTKMPFRDAIVAYGESEPTTDFYIRRNKASLSVTRINRAKVA